MMTDYANDFDLFRRTRETAHATDHANIQPAFLRLPAEIRNQIYEYVVLRNFSIDILASPSPHRPSSRTVQPAVSRTCRQLRRETLPIFYANTFEVDCMSCLRQDESDGGTACNKSVRLITATDPPLQGLKTVRQWLSAIGSHNRRHLGSILFCCPKEDLGQLVEALSKECGVEFSQTPQVSNALTTNWYWSGKMKGTPPCFANVMYRAGLEHYKVALQG